MTFQDHKIHTFWNLKEDFWWFGKFCHITIVPWGHIWYIARKIMSPFKNLSGDSLHVNL